MQIKEIMSKDIERVLPDSTIDEATQKMRETDAGAILIGDEENILGLITDHDIATKVVAEGHDPRDVMVKDVMSSPVLYCFEDEEAEDVADNMLDQHALRMLVVDQSKKAKGIVAHSDLADAVVKSGQYNEPLAQKVIKLASKIAA